MATIKLKLVSGSKPNFIKVDNGHKEHPTYVDVCDLTKDELEEFIRLWSIDFRQHVIQRKSNLKTSNH